MSWIVPIAKPSDCPPDPEHWERIEVVVDEFGVVNSICPEHGPILRIESMEFDTEDEAKAFVSGRQATLP